jgi:hypothetical protein
MRWVSVSTEEALRLLASVVISALFHTVVIKACAVLIHGFRILEVTLFLGQFHDKFYCHGSTGVLDNCQSCLITTLMDFHGLLSSTPLGPYSSGIAFLLLFCFSHQTSMLHVDRRSSYLQAESAVVMNVFLMKHVSNRKPCA